MIDWLCLKQPKIKDQNSGSQLMLMRVTLEKPQRDGSFNFRQTNFKDFSGENYSFSRRLVKFNIFSRLSEPWKNTKERIENLIYTKDNLLVT